VEDFTTHTKSDPQGTISVTSSTITFTNLTRNATAYVASDKGVNHFSGNFEHLVRIKKTAHQNYSDAYLWALANALQHFYRTTNYLALPSSENGTAIKENDGTSSYAVSLYAISLGTTYYVRISRDESVGTYGTLYAYIYSDSSMTTLLDEASLLLHAKQDFRYVYGLGCLNTGESYYCSGEVSNLDLQEGETDTGFFNFF
jgi:hypothetical protein